MYTAHKGGEL